MILRTLQANGTQIRHRINCRALKDAMSFGQHVNMIEHLVHGCGWLMNGTDDCASLAGQIMQQTYAIGR